MPQMTLVDFEDELKARGFDGFNGDDLDRYINWGYAHIARKFPWYWEQTSVDFTVNPGDPPVALSAYADFRALDFLVVTTTGRRRMLDIAKRQDFFANWLPLDLTITANRGQPARYYVYENQLFILPPPDTTTDFTMHYRRRVPQLATPGSIPITPPHLDEAIVIAAMIRCHKRAYEISLAQQAELDLMEFFDDMYTDEELLMAESQDRLLPDDTWL